MMTVDYELKLLSCHCVTDITCAVVKCVVSEGSVVFTCRREVSQVVRHEVYILYTVWMRCVCAHTYVPAGGPSAWATLPTPSRVKTSTAWGPCHEMLTRLAVQVRL